MRSLLMLLGVLVAAGSALLAGLLRLLWPTDRELGAPDDEDDDPEDTNGAEQR